MLKTLALAGATAALVIGSIAVAQTTNNGAMASPNAPATNPAYNSNNPTDNMATAPAAGEAGANTAATTGPTPNTAGERG
jgi:hypothetical protein